MSYITHCSKTVDCPKWNIRVTLSGKYLFTNSNKPNEAKFVTATCPIIENGRLSPDKQCEEFFLLRCTEAFGCHQLKDFKPIIDIEQDGYSQ